MKTLLVYYLVLDSLLLLSLTFHFSLIFMKTLLKDIGLTSCGQPYLTFDLLEGQENCPLT